jgi:hypothetical protein
MVGYKVYLFEGTKGYELIAVLPERRKNAKRKTEESVINWGRTLWGDGVKGKNILFERVTINSIRERILWMNPFAKCH